MSYKIEDSLAYKILESRKAYKFMADINQIFVDISPILNEICIFFNNYTLHNIDHSVRVLYNMCAMSGEDTLKKLSNLELAMVVYVALLHDVGMWIFPDEIEKIEDNAQFKFYLKRNCGDKMLALQDYIRPIHGKRSYRYLMNDKKLRSTLCDNRLSTVSFIEDVALICQSHMESIDWINKNLKESFSKGDHYNSKYIALLLRIADYIDFDSQRAPQYLLEHKNLKEISLTEWKKHAIVCNVEKVNKASKEIHFDIECSDFNLFCKLKDTLDLMDKEVNDCITYSKTFLDSNYHLQIKNKIQFKIETKGFRPERFSFSLDYYKVTNLLMGENLYGDKRFGFRELLQNGFDACNVMKEYYSTYDPTSSYEPQISIIYDYDNNTISIKDNGTGMSKDIIRNYFLTIGKSYYRSDEYEKLGYKFNPTGTFGIGFLSCFMISKKVTVFTKYYEDGEVSSFSIEKDSKYICYLDESFSGIHGTEIILSMREFDEVFSKESLLGFINDNFYRLDTKVKIYDKKLGVTKYVNKAEATNLTRYLDIDLSQYLDGVECRASLVTLLEEFKLYNSFSEVCVDDYNSVLITLKGIQFIPQNLMHEHYNKRCLTLYSTASFEELIFQTFDGQCVDSYDYDIEELIEDFEKYGFKVFSENFNKYLEEGNREWWMDTFDSFDNMSICVLWDDSLEDKYILDILKRTKMRYLMDIDAISKDAIWGYEDESYIANSDSVYEDFESNELTLSYIPNHITSYRTNVCYRGVLLNDVNLRIPHIANILTVVNIVANVFRSDFIPSVSRRGLTDEQERMLSYAIGKALHIYLLDYFSNDKEVMGALKNLLKKNYSLDNMLCQYSDLY